MRLLANLECWHVWISLFGGLEIGEEPAFCYLTLDILIMSRQCSSSLSTFTASMMVLWRSRLKAGKVAFAFAFAFALHCPLDGQTLGLRGIKYVIIQRRSRYQFGVHVTSWCCWIGWIGWSCDFWILEAILQPDHAFTSTVFPIIIHHPWYHIFSPILCTLAWWQSINHLFACILQRYRNTYMNLAKSSHPMSDSNLPTKLTANAVLDQT